MGQILKGTLKKEIILWCKASFLSYGNNKYEISEFRFFNPSDGNIIVETNSDWFDNNNSLDCIEFSRVEMRDSIDLKCQHPFFIINGTSLFGCSSSTIIMFIPATLNGRKEELFGELNSGLTLKYEYLEISLYGGYNTIIRHFCEEIVDSAYIKRTEICDECSEEEYVINEYFLRKIILYIKEKGYVIDDLISPN